MHRRPAQSMNSNGRNWWRQSVRFPPSLIPSASPPIEYSSRPSHEIGPNSQQNHSEMGVGETPWKNNQLETLAWINWPERWDGRFLFLLSLLYYSFIYLFHIMIFFFFPFYPAFFLLLFLWFFEAIWTYLESAWTKGAKTRCVRTLSKTNERHAEGKRRRHRRRSIHFLFHFILSFFFFLRGWTRGGAGGERRVWRFSPVFGLGLLFLCVGLSFFLSLLRRVGAGTGNRR